MFLPKWFLLSMRLALIGYVTTTLNLCFALRIGVMDDTAVLSSPSLQVLMKGSETKMKKLSKELETLSNKLQVLQNEFSKNEMIMDEATRQQKQQALIKLSQHYQAKIVQVQKESGVLESRIKQAIEDACVKVAKREKLNILFSRRGVSYADKDFDVTKEVIDACSNKPIISEVVEGSTEVSNTKSTESQANTA